MGRCKILTERDLALLNSLYNLGAMTMNQIHELVYKNTSQYGRKRVQELIKRGYLVRIGHVYRITDKGLREINITTTTPAKKFLTKYNLDTKIRLSEIHSKLHAFNWYLQGSRLAKAEFNLNRNSSIEGILRNTLTGDKYIVYLLNKEPLKKTINKIKTEINFLQKIFLDRVIIFYLSELGYSYFMDESIYGASRLHLLPHGLGLEILRHMSDPAWLHQIVKREMGDFPVYPTDMQHADLIVDVNGKEYYITEMITYDKVKRYHLLNYAHDAAEEDDREVILFTLESLNKNIEDLRETFQAYPHIRVVTIEDEYFEHPPTPADLSQYQLDILPESPEGEK